MALYCLRANRNLVGLDLALKSLLQFSREQTLTQLVLRDELLLAFLKPVTGVPASTQSAAALSRSDVPGGRAAVATIQIAKAGQTVQEPPESLIGGEQARRICTIQHRQGIPKTYQRAEPGLREAGFWVACRSRMESLAVCALLDMVCL